MTQLGCCKRRLHFEVYSGNTLAIPHPGQGYQFCGRWYLGFLLLLKRLPWKIVSIFLLHPEICLVEVLVPLSTL